MGAFASIYHPVGIPMLVQKARNFGFTIGLNGLVGNMGIAIAAGVSVYIAQRFGWQMAFILPGMICLVCARGFRACWCRARKRRRPSASPRCSTCRRV